MFRQTILLAFLCKRKTELITKNSKHDECKRSHFANESLPGTEISSRAMYSIHFCSVFNVRFSTTTFDLLFIFLGVGNGTFQTNFTSYATVWVPYVVRTGDFNGDSHPDLVVGNFYHSAIQIYMGTGVGTFVTSPFATYAFGIANPIDIVIRDLNGDTTIDSMI